MLAGALGSRDRSLGVRLPPWGVPRGAGLEGHGAGPQPFRQAHPLAVAAVRPCTHADAIEGQRAVSTTWSVVSELASPLDIDNGVATIRVGR